MKTDLCVIDAFDFHQAHAALQGIGVLHDIGGAQAVGLGHVTGLSHTADIHEYHIQRGKHGHA